MKGSGYSIRLRLLLTLGVVVVAVIAFSFLMLFLYRGRNNELLYRAFAETLALMARNVETELDSFEDFSVSLMTDPYVQDKLERMNRERRQFDWYVLAEELKGKLITYFNIRYLDCIFAVDTSGRVVSCPNDYPAMENYVPEALLEDFRRSREPARWIETDSTQEGIYYLRRVRRVKGLSLEDIGVLCFILRKERFRETVFKFDLGYDLQIGVQGKKRLLYASSPVIRGIWPEAGASASAGYQTRRSSGEEYFITFFRSPQRPLLYLCVAAYGSLFGDIEFFNTLFLITSCGLFLLFLFITFQLTRSVSAPIIRLAEEIKSIESEDFSQAKHTLGEYRGKDEIGVLYREFRLMLTKIENLIHENYRKQLLIKDAQFKTLQAQINPHFLYNTLESINWIAQLNGQERIAAMVQALGDLLRVSINGQKLFVTMEEEAELLRQYVLIQKIRYDERLSVTIDVGREVHPFAIPKLTLQPFVENAIKYGLESNTGQCRIAVRAELNGRSLSIRISDNGPGIEPSLVRRILEGKVEARGSGLGIKNIHERLKECYAGECGLRLDPAPGGGTTVTITVARLGLEEARALLERRSVHA
jgi:two-component system sensor histidine kinase YesM